MTMDQIEREGRFKALEERAGKIALALGIPFSPGKQPEDARLQEIDRVLTAAEQNETITGNPEAQAIAIDSNIPPGNLPDLEPAPEPGADVPPSNEPWPPTPTE